ncbi:hypothetical protein JY97_14815 [Alkalispirochaeta odontotermitis]|nr:hypothetical protein JY97_14815 [Alkalispirochaeta odontotermitis]
MSKLKGWRTISANVLTIAISVLEVSSVTDYLENDQALYFVAGLAIANIVLRLLTSTPVGRAD